jgi:hypothetical protein
MRETVHMQLVPCSRLLSHGGMHGDPELHNPVIQTSIEKAVRNRTQIITCSQSAWNLDSEYASMIAFGRTYPSVGTRLTQRSSVFGIRGSTFRRWLNQCSSCWTETHDVVAMKVLHGRLTVIGRLLISL